MPLSQLPAFLSSCFDNLSAALDRRSAPRLFRLFLGALFAKGRRTGTLWLCHCAPFSMSVPRTSPQWPSVIRGRLPPSWNWPSNSFVGYASGWAAWTSKCVWSSMADTPSVPSSSR